MGSVSVILPQSGRQIVVRVDRKKMKNCRLKVYPGQSVVLSAPRTVPESWLRDFLERNAAWIEEKLKKFAEAAEGGDARSGVNAGGDEAAAWVRDGCTVRLLGRQRLISVRESVHDRICCEGDAIRIESRDIYDQKKLQVRFDRWWREEALQYLETRVDVWFPDVEKYGKTRPEIHVRRMRTLWGSCNVSRGKVTFNLNLIREAPECIDYVVLHELTHLIHPNHSKQFYDFIGVYMPDWKLRKEKLDRRQTTV